MSLRTNDLQMVSTDHCPFCMKGRRNRPRRLPARSPMGSARSSTGWTCSIRASSTGRITLERWVEITSTTPARMFGLYGRKGVIAPGADADLVVYDPMGTPPSGQKTHHMNMDHSAWEGYEIDGHVDTVISRARVIVDGGSYLGAKGDGRFVKRGLTQYLT